MIPSLFSVSYAGLWGQHKLDTKQFIVKAAKLGYRAVQIAGKKPHISFNHITDKELNEIKDTAKKYKVEIHTIAGYNDFTSGKGSIGNPFVDIQVGYINRCALLLKNWVLNRLEYSAATFMTSTITWKSGKNALRRFGSVQKLRKITEL